MTKSEIIEELNRLGLEYDSEALKTDLQKLLESSKFEVYSRYVGLTLYTPFGKFRLSNKLDQAKMKLLYEKGHTDKIKKL